MIANALNGVRVIDLSRILAGPWCTQNLADLGAEVIKIEKPGSGDDTRQWGPPYLEGDGQQMSAYFMACNRGKRSICLDFKSEEGRARLLQLIPSADVLVENYRAGTLKRYGLDYESLAKINPRLVYASITGYGQSGPKSQRSGYDYIFQGMGGLMSYTGHPEGKPGAGPLRTGVAVIDITTGMYATSAILAALFQRARTERGACLDLALMDVAVAMNANQAANYLVSGESPERTGNAHPNLAPYEVFKAADSHFILAIGNDNQFARFCEFCDRRELAADPRFNTNSGRIQHLDALREELAAILITRPRKHWTDALDRLGISWGAINTLEEVFDDEQVKHRHMLQEIDHPVLGRIKLVANPMLDPASRRRPIQNPPPLLGEHNYDI